MMQRAARAGHALRGTGWGWAACLLLACLLATPAAKADSASSGSGTLPRTAAVNLAFTIGIDKFLFFRVGDGAWPTPSGTVDSVAFALTPSIPGVPTAPVNGSNRTVNWNGATPLFAVAPSGVVLPVEVRSNAGIVNLRATASAPLTSATNAANTIPLSEITVSSSDSALPAPSIPNSGSGTPVNVATGGTGTSANTSSQVTLRNANWTFSYANAANRPAGSYAGQVSFTASSP